MSTIFQLAGKARVEGAPQLSGVFQGLADSLRAAPGFERARLLLSGQSLQTQLLLQWASFDEALAYYEKFQAGLGVPFQPLVQAHATLITSVLDFSTLPRDAVAQPGEPVVLHFSGLAPANRIDQARALLREAVIPALSACPGFQGVEVLVNHREGKLQMLASFGDYDPAYAWFQANFRTLLPRFDGVIERPAPPCFFALAGDIQAEAATTA